MQIVFFDKLIDFSKFLDHLQKLYCKNDSNFLLEHLRFESKNIWTFIYLLNNFAHTYAQYILNNFAQQMF